MSTPTPTQLKVRELLAQLIENESGINKENDPENFTIARDYVLKKFKTHTFHRASQFDVLSRLNGLEEKFRVLNREDLGDALAVRTAALPDLSGGSTIVPDVLHLLLELSDDPLHKTQLSSLDKLIPPPAPRELTWADIIAEDPLDEDEIWGDVDFGAESDKAWSDDEGRRLGVEYVTREQKREEMWEGTGEEGKKRRRRTKWGGGAEEDEVAYRVQGVEGFALRGDGDGLGKVLSAQYWEVQIQAREEELDVALVNGQRRSPGSSMCTSLTCGAVRGLWVVTELQALREVIFMILGFSSELFVIGEGQDPGAVRVDIETQYVIRHTSREGFVAILQWFAIRGTSLNRIRMDAKKVEELPERQSFMSAVEAKIAELDREIIAIEERYVGKGPSVTVSLLALQSQFEPLLRPFMTLSKIIETEKTTPITYSSHLEQLYQSACDLQSTGDLVSFHFIASIFFASLKTYLHPIRLWMESGVLPPPTTSFLVVQNVADDEVELGTLWHSQFSLRQSPLGILDAPSFVHPVAKRIFTTGKSVVFLKRLQPSTASEFDPHSLATGATDIAFEDVISPGDDLAPFSSLFLAAFNRWISARHHSVSQRLRTQLFTNCGLWPALTAMESIFFGRNGFLFEALAHALFERLDRKAANWADRFLLTELAQGVFTGAQDIDSHRLRLGARPTGAFSLNSSRTLRDPTINIALLSTIEPDYRLPWPVANIINPHGSLPTYRRVFSFLLQLRRAHYLLSHLGLLRLPVPPSAAGYFALRQRLLWFVNALITYITTIVLIPQTAALRTTLETAADLDAMCLCHQEFINRVRDMSLLGKKMAPIHDAIISVLTLAVRFTYYQVSHASGTTASDFPRRPNLRAFLPTPRTRRRRGSESSGDEELPSPSVASSTVANSDDEDQDDDEDEMTGEQRYAREVGKMVEEFGGLLGFVRDGLRGVARAGVAPHLEMLAEGLEGYGAGVWSGSGDGDHRVNG